MADNRDYIAKADTLLSTLAPGGILQPAQADEFVRLAVDRSVVLPMMTRVDMRAPTEYREKITFGTRSLVGGTEVTSLPLGQRAAPTTSKVQLSAQLVKAEARISFESLEDSIEGGRFEQTVRDTLAEKISFELEELSFNGDTTSADALLKVLDGFIKQTTTNTVAGGSATLQRSLLKDTLKTMPSAFRRDKRSLRFMTADEAAIDYQEHLGDRATPVGDGQATTDVEARPFQSIAIIGVPAFPTNLGGGSNETVVILTDPANMLFGVWRDIRMDVEKKASEQVLIIVMSARVDFKYAHEPASVKTTAVKAT
jgi:HK97 family phage major capsid protein